MAWRRVVYDTGAYLILIQAVKAIRLEHACQARHGSVRYETGSLRGTDSRGNRISRSPGEEGHQGIVYRGGPLRGRVVRTRGWLMAASVGAS